jgi:hypothetical protein
MLETASRMRTEAVSTARRFSSGTAPDAAVFT